jgi:hypothetical protein
VRDEPPQNAVLVLAHEILGHGREIDVVEREAVGVGDGLHARNGRRRAARIEAQVERSALEATCCSRPLGVQRQHHRKRRLAAAGRTPELGDVATRQMEVQGCGRQKGVAEVWGAGQMGDGCWGEEDACEKGVVGN